MGFVTKEFFKVNGALLHESDARTLDGGCMYLEICYVCKEANRTQNISGDF